MIRETSTRDSFSQSSRSGKLAVLREDILFSPHDEITLSWNINFLGKLVTIFFIFYSLDKSMKDLHLPSGTKYKFLLNKTIASTLARVEKIYLISDFVSTAWKRFTILSLCIENGIIFESTIKYLFKNVLKIPLRTFTSM